MKNMPDSNEVHAWPEFQAFVKRLGINLNLPTQALVIRMERDCLVEIQHTHNAIDNIAEKQCLPEPEFMARIMGEQP